MAGMLQSLLEKSGEKKSVLIQLFLCGELKTCGYRNLEISTSNNLDFEQRTDIRQPQRGGILTMNEKTLSPN